MGFYRYYSTQVQTQQFPHESLVFVLQRLNLIQHNVQNLHIRGFHSHPAHITNGHNDFFYYRLLQWFAARCAASPYGFALQAAITWLILTNSLRLTAFIIGYERKALEEVAATTFHVWESHPVVHIKAAMEDRLMRPL